MKWDITTPATSLAVSFEDAAWHCRIDGYDEQPYIEDLIQDVTSNFENATDCSVLPQTLTATYWDVTSSDLELPRGPVNSITSITSDGTTLSASDYELRRIGTTDYVHFDCSISTPIVVIYTAGYSTLPPDIRRELLNQIGTHYENRETLAVGTIVSPLPYSDAIVRRYRRGAMAI